MLKQSSIRIVKNGFKMFSSTASRRSEHQELPWNPPHLAVGSAKPTIDQNKVYLYNMRFCPYAERAVLALLAKNVPFQNININLNFRQKQKPEWFLEETFGQVPVLLYKNNIIPESLIVCDLIDELFEGPKLYPEDPMKKANDRVLLAIFDRLRPSFFKIVWSNEEEAKIVAYEDLCEKLKPIEEEYLKRGTTFFAGENPGMLDWLMWPWFERLPVFTHMNLPVPHFPGLNAYQQAMWNTGPVKDYGLSADEHFQFLSQFSDKTTPIDYDFLIKK